MPKSLRQAINEAVVQWVKATSMTVYVIIHTTVDDTRRPTTARSYPRP
jgi:tryptophan synthase beta subunit